MTAKAKTAKNIGLIEQIKAKAQTIKTSEVVKVDEWDAEIEVRSMKVGESGILADAEDPGKFTISMLTTCCFDPETGEQLFGADDLEWLSDQPAGVVGPLMAKATELSGITDAAVDQGKDGS